MRTSGNATMAPTFDMNVAPPPFITIEKVILAGLYNYETLAGLINSVPYEPAFLRNIGLYEYQSTTTRMIRLDFDGQAINLVPNTPPEGTPPVITRKTRQSAIFQAPRYPVQFTVRPEEVAAIMALDGDGFDSIETDATIKLRNAVRNLRTTHEWARLNAACGNLLDADGSTIINYFTALGITRPTYDMRWGTAGVDLLSKCTDILNMIEDALGGLDNTDNQPGAIVPDTPPIVICGRAFWKFLMTDASFKTAYTYFQANDQRYIPTRNDTRYVDFEFGGIIWRQYRGAVNGSRFVPDAVAQVLIPDLPGTYLGYMCPPEDDMEALNKPGLPMTMTAHVLPHNQGVEFRAQSNVLHACTRPSIAIELFSSN